MLLPGLLKGRREGTSSSQPRGRAGAPEPTRSQRRQPRFPARRGGPRNRNSRQRFDRSSRSSYLSIGDFPVPENRSIARSLIWGPKSGRQSVARQRRRQLSTFPSQTTCNQPVHWVLEPLWLNRASTERAGQRYRHTQVPASEEPCIRKAQHEPAIGTWRYDLGARIGP